MTMLAERTEITEPKTPVQIDAAKFLRAREYFESSGIQALLAQLKAENSGAEKGVFVTVNIHPASVGERIRRLPNLESSYIDLYAWEQRNAQVTKDCPDYEEIPCGLVIIQATSLGNIRFHGSQMSLITQDTWSTDSDALKTALGIAKKNPLIFNQSRYNPKINPSPNSNENIK